MINAEVPLYAMGNCSDPPVRIAQYAIAASNDTLMAAIEAGSAK